MLQPSLIVVGLSYPGSPVAVRERFWMDETRRMDALAQLGAAEGIHELTALVNADRTEFIIWAADLSLAASSVLSYLTGQHGLRLCEWKNFYRLVDESALTHLIELASGLKSRFDVGTEILDDFRSSLAIGRNAGVTGPHLETALEQLLLSAARLRHQTGIGFPQCLPVRAALDLAAEKLGKLSGRKILVLTKEPDAGLREAAGRNDVRVISPTSEPVLAVSEPSGAKRVTFEECWREMVQADVVIHVSSPPGFTFTHEQAGAIASRANTEPLHIFDLAIPRRIDPGLRSEPGLALYDRDQLREAWEKSPPGREAAERKQLVVREAKSLLASLRSATSPPAPRIAYGRIKELCREVAHDYTSELAASEEQARAIEGVSGRIASRICSYLNAEPHGARPTLMSAVRRLFQDGRNRAGVAGPEN